MTSIVILTKNEEIDIAGCLKSIAWCDDIHILDSGSTDSTLEIAENFGAKIWINKFQSFGQQRNFALDNIVFKYEWVFFLDADERVTKTFYNALGEAIKNADNDTAGFYCCWKMILDDVWLKKSDNFPKWQFRVMRLGKSRFKDFGHGQKEDQITGKIEYIKEPYLHYGFSKGWFHWLERHNRYSSQEALTRLNSTPPFKYIFARHQSIRNPALKSWLCRLPGWPALRFIYTYIFSLGFIEGMPGFIYCANMGYYEFLIKIKIRELKEQKKRASLMNDNVKNKEIAP